MFNKQTITEQASPANAANARRPNGSTDSRGAHGRRARSAFWVAAVGLLVFAGIGVVFTARHRAHRQSNDSPSPTEIAASKGPTAEIGPVSRATPSHSKANGAKHNLHEWPSLPAAVQKAAVAKDVVGPSAISEPIDVEPTREFVGPPAPGDSGTADGNSQKAAVAKLPATDPPAHADADILGTNVGFVTKAEAIDRAKGERKLIFLVQYAGSFENGAFTCDKAEDLRRESLLNDEVADLLRAHFICATQKIGDQRLVKGVPSGGNVASYICLADGTVLHALPGPQARADLLRETRWSLNSFGNSLSAYRRDISRIAPIIRKAHYDRYEEETTDLMKVDGKGVKQKAKVVPDTFEGWPRGFDDENTSARNRQSTSPSSVFRSLPDFEFNRRLPIERPDHLPYLTQVHWYFAVCKRPLPQLNEMSKWVYEVVLNGQIAAP